ncbi:MAG: hypothetical protein KKA73_26680 [Chloroflexi bacterium]|nr:hypothetical protein [Chloroflexota bacterium]MBU1751287.1 hypothetical protein [Chloroflexota bacterium]MBU1880381.1 hypothetical protein [Chloroflexota bacterium]
MTKTGDQAAPMRSYDPQVTFAVGERLDLGPAGTGTITEVLAWSAPPTPHRQSLTVTMDDGRLLYFAAGMGDQAPERDLTGLPAMLPAEAAPDSATGWRAALARLVGQQVPLPGSRQRLHIKALSGEGVQVAPGNDADILLPWRGLEAARHRLQERGQLALVDLETLVPDLDANLVTALLLALPGVRLETKPATLYWLDVLARDETICFDIPLRPVYLSKSFVTIPSEAWSALPLSPLGEHVYIPVIMGDTFTMCRLSHRDSPEEARLYLRGDAGQSLREDCQEDEVLRFWPLRNTRGEFVALAVERAT